MAYLLHPLRARLGAQAGLAGRTLVLGAVLLLAAKAGRAQHAPTERKAAELPVAVATPAAVSAPAAAAPQEISPDSIFVNPEVRPQFVGGERALAQYLSETTRYPEKALRSRVAGRVYVNFVLSATGRVQDAHVVRGPGYGLNEEALRVVWLMPPWEPAQANGRPVRVVCTIPISFIMK